jgi:phage replication O-like protein O
LRVQPGRNEKARCEERAGHKLKIGKPMTTTNVINIYSSGNSVTPDNELKASVISNFVLKKMCHVDLSGAQFRILSAVFGMTFGYELDSNITTTNHIAELTGLSDRSVRYGLKELQLRKMISVSVDGDFKEVTVNQDLSQWILDTGKSAQQAKNALSRFDKRQGH